MPTVTIDQVEQALKATAGNITLAAQTLHVSRMTIYRKVNKNPRLKSLIEEQRENLVDYAESQLRAAVLSGNMTAVIFTLKTLGKSRGYVERVESTGANGGPIEQRTEVTGSGQLTDEKRTARINELFNSARERRDGPAVEE